jgi:hypothetical protein
MDRPGARLRPPARLEGHRQLGLPFLRRAERIYNSGVRPAARPGTSNHEGSQFPRGAVDVSDAQTLSRILQGSKYAHLLVWAGGKDPIPITARTTDREVHMAENQADD